MYLRIYVKSKNYILLIDTFLPTNKRLQGNSLHPSKFISEKTCICNVTDWNCSIIKMLICSFDRGMNTIFVYLYRLYKPHVGEGGIFLAKIGIK